MKINIKPMSVNCAWQGKRYKSPEYKAYEKELLLRMKPMHIPAGRLNVYYRIGFSSPLADLGNVEKPLTDILCKRYGFDDNRIFRFVMEKEIVPKGQEFISYEIQEYIYAPETLF
jgi:Holliday junction resolvase RusA-like endonuclease